MVLEQYNHTFIGVLTVNYHTFIKNDVLRLFSRIMLALSLDLYFEL